MPLILGTNSIKDTGYDVANSCMFNDGDSPDLKKTNGSSGNRKTWTFSAWIKRGVLGTAQNFFSGGTDGDNQNYNRIQFNADDDIYIAHVDSGSTTTEKQTDMKFRDPSAWMHIVWVLDTTQGTAGNREKLYVNGVQVTSFSTNTIPAEDYEGTMSEDVDMFVGNQLGTWEFFDGYMAEVVFIDGSALAPTSFGEFDEDSPTIWKPKDVSGLTFGTNGFYLDFEASANLGNDANSGTDFTESNLAATDQSTDTPTNNFCTLNPLIRWGTNNSEFKEGNLVYDDSRGDWRAAVATFGATAGKWYFEIKLGGGTYHQVGIVGTSTPTSAQNLIDQTAVHGGYSIYNTNGDLQARTDNAAISGWDSSTLGTTAETDDILQVALDMDNTFLYFGKNGTFLKSGDPTSGATGTGGINISADYTSGVVAIPGVTMYSGSDASLNFGSPAYANTSDAADGNGYGAFEFAPPSGYLALCTKNLGSTGG